MKVVSKAKKETSVVRLERVVTSVTDSLAKEVKDLIILENKVMEQQRELESFKYKLKFIESHIKDIWDAVDPDERINK